MSFSCSAARWPIPSAAAAVAAVSWWGLEGIWRLIRWAWRLRHAVLADARDHGARRRPAGPMDRGPSRGASSAGDAADCRDHYRTGFMTVALGTYLPTFLSLEGASLWQAGSALSIVEMAGAVVRSSRARSATGWAAAACWRSLCWWRPC